MQPIKKILYSFMWCKSYIETQKRWNIFKDFIACFLLEKQGYPHSPYCTNRKNQVRVNMHWFISQLHRNICYHFLPAFVNFTPCSITPSDQILFLSFFTVICNVHSFLNHSILYKQEKPDVGEHALIYFTTPREDLLSFSTSICEFHALFNHTIWTKKNFVIFYCHMQRPQLFNHTMWQEKMQGRLEVSTAHSWELPHGIRGNVSAWVLSSHHWNKYSKSKAII